MGAKRASALTRETARYARLPAAAAPRPRRRRNG